jgi:hypothetical protein
LNLVERRIAQRIAKVHSAVWLPAVQSAAVKPTTVRAMATSWWISVWVAYLNRCQPLASGGQSVRRGPVIVPVRKLTSCQPQSASPAVKAIKAPLTVTMSRVSQTATTAARPQRLATAIVARGVIRGSRSASRITPVENHQRNRANPIGASQLVTGLASPGWLKPAGCRDRVGFGLHEVESGERKKSAGAKAKFAQLAADATGTISFAHGLVDPVELAQALQEFWIVQIKQNREALLGDLGGRAEHLHVVLFDIHAERLVEGRTRLVAHMHGAEHRQQEEADPKLVAALQQLGSARISSENASPWRNSSLHHSSNHLKIGWKRLSGCFSRWRKMVM